jgi:O-antigen/teichoic acid export membrane protein
MLERLAAGLGGYGVARRLAGGTAANLMGKLWVVLVQIVSIPVLTACWGAEGYGLWLMLSTIPTYVSLTDFGLGTATAVEVTIKMARNDRAGALRAFQSTWVLVTALAVLVALGVIAIGIPLVGGGAALWLPDRWRQPFAGGPLFAAIVLMTLYAVVAMQMSLIGTVYSATHKYALGTFLRDLLVPVEGAAVITAAMLHGAIFEAAASMLLIRLCGYFAYHHGLRRLEPWFRVGWRHADRQTARRLLRPSIAAFALTAANAVGLQGVILTLGWVAGPAVVAVFGATRLLTRVPVQFSTLVSRASLPELTRSQTAGDVRATRSLIRLNLAAAGAIAGGFLVLLLIGGPWLLAVISHGTLVAPYLLFVLLGIAGAANAIWTAAASPIIARNEQWRFAYLYMGLCAVTALLPLVLGSTDAVPVAASIAIAEFATLALVTVLLRRSTGVRPQ